MKTATKQRDPRLAKDWKAKYDYPNGECPECGQTMSDEDRYGEVCGHSLGMPYQYCQHVFTLSDHKE